MNKYGEVHLKAYEEICAWFLGHTYFRPDKASDKIFRYFIERDGIDAESISFDLDDDLFISVYWKDEKNGHCLRFTNEDKVVYKRFLEGERCLMLYFPMILLRRCKIPFQELLNIKLERIEDDTG